MTVFDVLRQLWLSPRELLLRKWNWKSAVFSSLIRAGIFFGCTLRAGWSAALGAMLAEFAYRSVTAGFYGALTQAFRKARPIWTANVAVMILLPFVSHSLELCIHLARGTPKLVSSIIVSVCFTAISTVFNLYAMRRGALIVGEGACSMTDDLRRVPALIAGFLACGPIAAYRWLMRSPASSRTISTGLLLIPFCIFGARSVKAAEISQTSSPDKHFVRFYKAAAQVNLLSLTIFSRSGVGGGFASMDETGLSGDRSIRLRFLSGSTPERAHGLNRAGFIEERIHSANNIADSISYFGFITDNREESLSAAKASLNCKTRESIPYVAAEGFSNRGSAQYSVRKLLLESSLRWSDPSELVQTATTAFRQVNAVQAGTSSSLQDARTRETFLYALTRLIASHMSHAETAFIHNGRLYRLRAEQGADESTGRDLQRNGLLPNAKDLIRMKGSIRAEDANEETIFLLWYDQTSPNVLPLRFEFRPRSYLKLVFDASIESPTKKLADIETEAFSFETDKVLHAGAR